MRLRLSYWLRIATGLNFKCDVECFFFGRYMMIEMWPIFICTQPSQFPNAWSIKYRPKHLKSSVWRPRSDISTNPIGMIRKWKNYEPMGRKLQVGSIKKIIMVLMIFFLCRKRFHFIPIWTEISNYCGLALFKCDCDL